MSEFKDNYERKKRNNNYKECQKINKSALLRQFDVAAPTPSTIGFLLSSSLPGFSLSLSLCKHATECPHSAEYRPSLERRRLRQQKRSKVAQCQTQAHTHTRTDFKCSHIFIFPRSLAVCRSLFPLQLKCMGIKSSLPKRAAAKRDSRCQTDDCALPLLLTLACLPGCVYVCVCMRVQQTH